jgi:hypothetical protein
MDILIAGLILVALMVYASTRIKRAAARAYEGEIVEGDDWAIVKPEGFLSEEGDLGRHCFRAYSKDFGAGPSAELRKAVARITIHPGTSFEEIVERAKEEVGEVKRADVSRTGDARVCEMSARSQTSGVPVHIFYKIAAAAEAVYELRIEVLSESLDEYRGSVEEMLTGFVLK